MRWDDYRRSTNVDDMRGGNGGRAAGGVGIGGVILAAVLYFAFGVDPRVVLNSGLVGQGGPPAQQQSRERSPEQQRMGEFVSAILASTEDVWTQAMREQGREYQPPRLTLFEGRAMSACGLAEAAAGPFYCPMDRRVYLDTIFFQELATRFRAPGEFAAAYVIGHEVGHHVQNLLGILPRVQQRQQAMSREEANALQVRVELQADCFAGVWANRTGRALRIEEADIRAALQAASAIGDDTLQRQSQGYVVPESFTHGSSDQRMRWFMTGVRAGRAEACNTFQSAGL